MQSWGIRAVWLCALARVLFYAAMLPVWEGYDEWSHFAVIRLVALRGEALPPRDSPLPRDVGASLELVPLPWSWRLAGDGRISHDEFWQLPGTIRNNRETAFRVLPRDWQWQDSQGPYRAHEAYQPPFYYWTMAPLMRILGGAGVARQLLAVRWFGAFLGSLAIPVTFRIAGRLFHNDVLAVGCAAVVASMPGYALVISHAGNDCLAILLFSLLVWRGMEFASDPVRMADSIMLGALLGLGLLTKAYFLTAVPVVAVLAFWRVRWRVVVPIGCALLVGGWWYARAYIQTGTLTGLTDFVMAGGAKASLLRQALGLPWARALDSILFSHLYAGGWSFLQVRSWMYHVFYILGAVALIGLVRVRRGVQVLWLLGVYGCFWLGELYHVVILWAARGVATSMGYYLYGVVAAEIPLSIAGLTAILQKKRAWFGPAAGVTLFALLDLYAVHAVAIPYYTGLIRHKANGAMAALHASSFSGISAGEVLRRAVAFRALSAGTLFVLWAAYLAGTLMLIWIAASGFQYKDARAEAGRNSGRPDGFAAY